MWRQRGRTQPLLSRPSPGEAENKQAESREEVAKEEEEEEEEGGGGALDGEKCRAALASLRHAKWFQVGTAQPLCWRSRRKQVHSEGRAATDGSMIQPMMAATAKTPEQF